MNSCRVLLCYSILCSSVYWTRMLIYICADGLFFVHFRILHTHCIRLILFPRNSYNFSIYSPSNVVGWYLTFLLCGSNVQWRLGWFSAIWDLKYVASDVILLFCIVIVCVCVYVVAKYKITKARWNTHKSRSSSTHISTISCGDRKSSTHTQRNLVSYSLKWHNCWFLWESKRKLVYCVWHRMWWRY